MTYPQWGLPYPSYQDPFARSRYRVFKSRFHKPIAPGTMTFEFLAAILVITLLGALTWVTLQRAPSTTAQEATHATQR